MSTYVYGIVRAPAPAAAAKAKNESSRRSGSSSSSSSQSKLPALKLPDTGVGDPPAPVRLVKHRDLAAIVSDVADDYHPEAAGLRGMRRDMRLHAAILNGLIESVTPLPFRFGVVFPDDESVIARLLRPQYPRLSKYLDALDGLVEVTLKVMSVEQQALRQVIAEHPELAPRGGSGGGRRASLATESRIELGRQLAAAIHDLQERDARWIIDVLAAVVHDVRIGKPLRDLMALNASFLVERAKLKKFDRLLEKLNAEADQRLEFDCVGPLPPYSFVDLKL